MSNKSKRKNMSETTTMISGQIEVLESKVKSLEELLTEARGRIEDIELRIATYDVNDEVAKRLEHLRQTSPAGMGVKNFDLLKTLMDECNEIVNGECYHSEIDEVQGLLNRCDEFTGAYARYRDTGLAVPSGGFLIEFYRLVSEVGICLRGRIEAWPAIGDVLKSLQAGIEKMPSDARTVSGEVAATVESLKRAVAVRKVGEMESWGGRLTNLLSALSDCCTRGICHPDGDCVYADGVHRVRVKGALGRLDSDIVIDGEVYRDVKWVAGRHAKPSADGSVLELALSLKPSGKPRFIRPKREADKPRRPQKAAPRVRKPAKR